MCLRVFLISITCVVLAQSAVASSGAVEANVSGINIAKNAALFARNEDYPFMKLSPSGKFIATSADIAGEKRFVLLSTQPLAVHAAGRVDIGSIYDVQWLNDERIVIAADDRVGKISISEYTIGSGELNVIAVHNVFSGTWSVQFLPKRTAEDGAVRYMLKEYRGRQQLWYWQSGMQDPRIEFSFTHPWDLVVPGMPPGEWLMEEWEGVQYKVTHRVSENAPESGNRSGVREIFAGSYLKWESFRPLAVEPGTSLLYVAVSEDKNHELRIYDLKKDEFLQTLVSDPEYDAIAAPLVHEYTGKVVGFVYEQAKPRLVYVDESVERVMNRFDETLPDAVNMPVSFSQDGKMVVLQSFNSRILASTICSMWTEISRSRCWRKPSGWRKRRWPKRK